MFGLVIVLALVFEARLDQASNKIKAEMKQKEEQDRLDKVAEKEAFLKRLRTKADEGFIYAEAHDFDLNHAFLVDFSLHSGKDRLFVWDYKTNSVAFSSLCAHGTGKDGNKSSYTDIKYSNVEGSLCSSLGKYKTGIRSYSKWGINVHYKLHGLEKTNDQAFTRFVVLHSYGPVPEEEIYPRHLPLGYSQGCPVINDVAMQKIDDLMQKKEKPVLLWIYQ